MAVFGREAATTISRTPSTDSQCLRPRWSTAKWIEQKLKFFGAAARLSLEKLSDDSSSEQSNEPSVPEPCLRCSHIPAATRYSSYVATAKWRRWLHNSSTSKLHSSSTKTLTFLLLLPLSRCCCRVACNRCEHITHSAVERSIELHTQPRQSAARSLRPLAHICHHVLGSILYISDVERDVCTRGASAATGTALQQQWENTDDDEMGSFWVGAFLPKKWQLFATQSLKNRIHSCASFTPS